MPPQDQKDRGRPFARWERGVGAFRHDYDAGGSKLTVERHNFREVCSSEHETAILDTAAAPILNAIQGGL